jgi:site-specific DNA recombinase
MLIGNRDEILANCRLAQEVLCNCTEIDAELKGLQREIDVVAELLRKAVYENARIAQNQEEFNERNNRYWERHRIATERFNQLEEMKRERQAKSLSLGTFIRELESSPSVVEEFDERLWAVAVDTVTVTKDGKLHFRFKDGTEV